MNMFTTQLLWKGEPETMSDKTEAIGLDADTEKHIFRVEGFS
jgi:hypothetical protein